MFSESLQNDVFCVTGSIISEWVDGKYEYLKSNENGPIYYNNKTNQYLFPWLQSEHNYWQYLIGGNTSIHIAHSFNTIQQSPPYILNEEDFIKHWQSWMMINNTHQLIDDPNMRLIRCNSICIEHKQQYQGLYEWINYNASTETSIYYSSSNGLYLYRSLNITANTEKWEILNGQTSESIPLENINSSFLTCPDITWQTTENLVEEQFDGTTVSPTNPPTISPTNHPAIYPTNHPTIYPTNHPTIYPTNHPTIYPTNLPTISPTNHPTIYPTNVPTNSPTNSSTKTPVQIYKTYGSSKELIIVIVSSSVAVILMLVTIIFVLKRYICTTKTRKHSRSISHVECTNKKPTPNIKQSNTTPNMDNVIKELEGSNARKLTHDLSRRSTLDIDQLYNQTRGKRSVRSNSSASTRSTRSNSKYADILPPSKPPPIGIKRVLTAEQRLSRPLPPTPSKSSDHIINTDSI